MNVPGDRDGLDTTRRSFPQRGHTVQVSGFGSVCGAPLGWPGLGLPRAGTMEILIPKGSDSEPKGLVPKVFLPPLFFSFSTKLPSLYQPDLAFQALQWKLRVLMA